MSAKFNIDDAFQSDDEDPIRVYGSTCDNTPLNLRGKRRPDSVVNHQSNPKYTQLASTTPTDSHGNADTDDVTGELKGDVQKRLLDGCQSSSNSGFRRSTHSSASSLVDVEITTKTFHGGRWWRHPKVRENWKVVMASFILTIVGLGLLIAGIAIVIAQITVVQSFVFFVAGVICLIPGAYHVVYIYCAVKGKHGFSFYNLGVFK